MRKRLCEPLSQILVSGFAPGSKPEILKFTSDADFLVHLCTNWSPPGAAPPGWGYSVAVKSTGFTTGTAAPSFTVGAPANDEITINVLPGVTGFVTLQTTCRAKARIWNA
jgi:hypothetical protein